jgi:hypothetical protein
VPSWICGPRPPRPRADSRIHGEEGGFAGSLKITLACLDLAGTTVADRGAVETAFAEALGTLGIGRGTAGFDRAMAVIGESRGQPKIDVFRQVFAGDEALARTAALSFERSYGSVSRMYGTSRYAGTPPRAWPADAARERAPWPAC